MLPAAMGSTGVEMVKYFREMFTPACPIGVPVREIPDNCIEAAATPDLLFSKLDDWGHEALVIPHGTTWGYYTPMGSAWNKQLTETMHDPKRQTLVEVYSGHGNSEEFRSYREVIFEPDGGVRCPEPSESYLPSCWQAGEIIRERCLEAGQGEGGERGEDECERRAADARHNYAMNDVVGHHTIKGETPDEWGDAGQCRDCFLPAFNHRPRSSVQYMMALGRSDANGEPLRFRFGFMASSDNHSARPGTGYKEYDRGDMTEMRFASFSSGILGSVDPGEPMPESISKVEIDPTAFFGTLETERQSSFFLTGGLVAAHAEGRSRSAVWEALERREVYGTSGPRILMWFDLMNPPGTRGAEVSMGSAVAMSENPVFRVRAVGSLEQLPGCPDYAEAALGDRSEPGARPRRPVGLPQLRGVAPGLALRHLDARADRPLPGDPGRLVDRRRSGRAGTGRRPQLGGPARRPSRGLLRGRSALPLLLRVRFGGREARVLCLFLGHAVVEVPGARRHSRLARLVAGRRRRVPLGLCGGRLAGAGLECQERDGSEEEDPGAHGGSIQPSGARSAAVVRGATVLPLQCEGRAHHRRLRSHRRGRPSG